MICPIPRNLGSGDGATGLGGAPAAGADGTRPGDGILPRESGREARGVGDPPPRAGLGGEFDEFPDGVAIHLDPLTSPNDTMSRLYPGYRTVLRTARYRIDLGMEMKRRRSQAIFLKRRPPSCARFSRERIAGHGPGDPDKRVSLPEIHRTHHPAADPFPRECSWKYHRSARVPCRLPARGGESEALALAAPRLGSSRGDVAAGVLATGGGVGGGVHLPPGEALPTVPGAGRCGEELTAPDSLRPVGSGRRLRSAVTKRGRARRGDG